MVTAAKKEVTKETYVLKDGVGTHTIHDGPGEMRTLKAGDACELTANQAVQFRDKFEPYSAVLARSEVAKRTAEIAATLNKDKKSKASEEQKRLREEAEEALAAEKVKLSDETDSDDEDEGDSEEEGDEPDSDTPPAKAASSGAQGKATVAAPKALGVTKKK